MRKSRFTEEQIAYAIRQAEQGTPAAEICRKMGISEQTFYQWKKKFAGMGIVGLVAAFTNVHFLWWNVVGASAVFVIGYGISLLTPARAKD